jgi:acyl-coenzyme A thioesterase 13
MAAAARKWLEDAGAIGTDGAGAGDSRRRAFNALPLSGVRVALAERGRALCSLRVPAHLTVRTRPPPLSGSISSWLGSN